LSRDSGRPERGVKSRTLDHIEAIQAHRTRLTFPGGLLVLNYAQFSGRSERVHAIHNDLPF
jgi:hypothetical protein